MRQFYYGFGYMVRKETSFLEMIKMVNIPKLPQKTFYYGFGYI